MLGVAPAFAGVGTGDRCRERLGAARRQGCCGLLGR